MTIVYLYLLDTEETTVIDEATPFARVDGATALEALAKLEGWHFYHGDTELLARKTVVES